MITVQVRFSVLPERMADFVAFTGHNVRNSRLESGVVRFDFYKVDGADAEFVLFEQYQAAADQASHRETPHYQLWKTQITPLLTAPYQVSLLQALA